MDRRTSSSNLKRRLDHASHDLRNHYANLIRVALFYGSVCFLAFCGLSYVGWWMFPNHAGDDEGMRLMRWLGHVLVEKASGLALLSVTAFFAGRAHQPTGRWGLATGIAAAIAFQLICVLVYIARFGVAAYREYNSFIYTMWWTVLLAWFFGDLALRKQRLYEKQTH